MYNYEQLEKMLEDNIPGGLADEKSVRDFPLDQLNKGIQVELEHTDSEQLALEIATDHLAEDPAYYDKLEVIEAFRDRAVAELVVEAALALAAAPEYIVTQNAKDKQFVLWEGSVGQFHKANIIERFDYAQPRKDLNNLLKELSKKYKNVAFLPPKSYWNLRDLDEKHERLYPLKDMDLKRITWSSNRVDNKVIMWELKNVFFLATPYRKDFVQKIKALPQRRWFADFNVWYFPNSLKGKVLDMVADYFYVKPRKPLHTNIDLTEIDERDPFSKQPPKVKVPTIIEEGTNYVLKTPFNREFVNDLKLLPRRERGWNPEQKTWWVKKNQENLVKVTDLMQQYFGKQPQLERA